MTTLYVDNIAPNLQSKISAPNLTLPSGSVIQVVSDVLSGTVSTTGSTMVATGLSVTITPSSASSKILVTASVNNANTTDGAGVQVGVRRDGSVISGISNTSGGNTDTYDAYFAGGGGGMSNNDRKQTSGTIQFLDSPATTSAVTYTVVFNNTGSSTAYINRWGLNADQASISTLTAMEIAG